MENRLRIGIDISKAMGPRDGVGTYIRCLVKALMKIDPVNHYLLYSLFCPSDYSEFIRVFKDHGSNFVFRDERSPETGDVDLFHCTTYTVPLQYSGKLVFTLHDLTFITHPAYHTLGNKIHCLKGTLEAACFVDKFIAVSKSTQRDAVEHLGVDKERVEVVHSGVDETFYPRDDPKNSERLKDVLGIQQAYILCVGTIEPRKNIKRLIQAYSMLPESLRGRYLLVIAGGGGWLNSDVDALGKSEGLENQVRILGTVVDSDLPVLYSACDLFIYPSLYEGFGLPVLEAMACGAPVITSDISSLPEVAGDAAVFIDPYNPVSIRDAMSDVLTDKYKNQELRQKGIARSKEFSWIRTAEETLSIYHKVVLAGR